MQAIIAASNVVAKDGTWGMVINFIWMFVSPLPFAISKIMRVSLLD